MKAFECSIYNGNRLKCAFKSKNISACMYIFSFGKSFSKLYEINIGVILKGSGNFPGGLYFNLMTQKCSAAKQG